MVNSCVLVVLVSFEVIIAVTKMSGSSYVFTHLYYVLKLYCLEFFSDQLITDNLVPIVRYANVLSISIKSL